MAFDGRLLSGVGVLAAIVESGNFARAGEALGLTPSGVSRAVARLEARVGVRLFDRTPRAVTLTDEGRRFHAEIAPLLMRMEEAAEAAGGSASLVRGRLRVNVDPWFARYALAPRLPEFLARHPELTLEILVRDALGDLVGEGIDVAVRFGEPEPSALIARKLLETTIVTCASPAYLAERGEPRHPLDIENYECLESLDTKTGRPYGWEFRRGDEIIEPKIRGRLIVNDLATKLEACVAGLGVVQTFALGLDPWLKRGDLVQILPDWAEEPWPLYAYHPSRHLPPAKVRTFVKFVLSLGNSGAGKGERAART
jgi:DNA-binding transcriptional LysR family regulator